MTENCFKRVFKKFQSICQLQQASASSNQYCFNIQQFVELVLGSLSMYFCFEFIFRCIHIPELPKYKVRDRFSNY